MINNLRILFRGFANLKTTANRHLTSNIRLISNGVQSPIYPPRIPITINIPIVPIKKIIEKPIISIPLISPKPNKSLLIDNPLNPIINEIQAARLIVIRRKKMKKHKLRKLRKRMKYVWAKVRQKREMRKEKAFQAELLGQIKEAEKFSPVEYVQEKLNIVNMTILPNRWRGKRLPEFVIKDLITKAQNKKQAKQEAIERRKKLLATFKHSL
ncbi:uncharacterized protein LOC126910578 [Daktulosphaira vitifoliae]|uniref:uncharacterized protein LOC126910578 n=1 Tax=Daktulosphaira vitifoliae TaxID=58002 RepID=UPI0021A990CD|nr:uncharacterized protein LOC126910578 [Daktulosphaira vitifoliae]